MFFGDRKRRSLFCGVIVEHRIQQEYLFKEALRVLSPLGLDVVDVQRQKRNDGVVIRVTIMRPSGRTSIDDCANAHRLLQARLSVVEGTRELALEVSSPGIQRTLRDLYEFSLFRGRRCRILDSLQHRWIEGIIDNERDEGIVLRDVMWEDMKEHREEYHIPYSRIQKAKLAYEGEDIS